MVGGLESSHPKQGAPLLAVGLLLRACVRCWLSCGYGERVPCPSLFRLFNLAAQLFMGRNRVEVVGEKKLESPVFSILPPESRLGARGCQLASPC